MNQFLYKLEQYSRTGHLFKQVHRTLPLSIWNYTPEVQYGQLWDEITLQCRGLVTDNEGNVVAYHYESQTRNEDSDNLKKLQQDYHNNLLPFMLDNFDKIKECFLNMN